MPSLKPASLKARALQWLAQREHSRSELRVKLMRLAQRNDDVDAESAVQQVDALLDWLTQRNHLSELRFLEGRVHVRQGRYGNLRIRQELQHHGLGLDAAAQLALTASELERAREVWVKKFAGLAQDAAGRVRQMRFLSSRGFTPEVIRRVVRGEGGRESD